MMAAEVVQNTLTNGLNDQMVMGGQSGATSGMSISTRMAMVLSKGKPGGQASMGTGGIAPGASITTAPVGCTSMAGAAAVSTGTHTSRRTPGMSNFRTSASSTASTTRCSSGL